MTLTLNEKIVKETGIYFIDKITVKCNYSNECNYSDDRLDYHYIISEYYYECDEKFKTGIDDLLKLCGLKLVYNFMGFTPRLVQSTYSIFPNVRSCCQHVFKFI